MTVTRSYSDDELRAAVVRVAEARGVRPDALKVWEYRNERKPTEPSAATICKRIHGGWGDVQQAAQKWAADRAASDVAGP